MSTATVAAVGNAINWFEIPSSDFDRAVTFYETIFGKELRKGDFMGTPTAVFAYEQPAVSGCIVKEDGQAPSLTGSRVYLNANGIFDEVLLRVPKAGGKVENVVELPNGLVSSPGNSPPR